MLKKIRVVTAGIVFILCTLLFLDFTGLATGWFGFLAKIQFLPAVLALNAGIVIADSIDHWYSEGSTARSYAPLGIFQDVVARSFSIWRKSHKKFYRWSPEKKWLRYSVLAVFIVLLVAGFTSVAVLVAHTVRSAASYRIFFRRSGCGATISAHG